MEKADVIRPGGYAREGRATRWNAGSKERARKGLRRDPGTERKVKMSKIRVLLTDDHTLFRQGIRTLLSAETDLEVIGEAADAADALTLARKLRPDVILMDIGMAGMSSFEAARVIRKERPEIRVVFLSMYDDEEYLAECIEMGAGGYILKDSPADQLLTAIREVHRGGSYLTPRLLTRLVDDFRLQGSGPARPPRFGTLTKREREILKMLRSEERRVGKECRSRW